MNKFSFNVRNFSQMTHSHKPKIQFIGKRSLIHPDKHLIHHMDTPTPIVKEEKRAVSTGPSTLVNLNFRLKLSQEEIEVINNGGPLNFKDWSKVKLKKKTFI